MIPIAEMMHIVFACDSNYAQHATVAMTSILRQTEHPEAVRFYILDDAIDTPVKEKITATVRAHRADVQFCTVDATQFQDFFVSGQLSRAAYFRLEMGNLLPADVHKVIYLDCDLIVRADIRGMWDFDMQGKPLAAVPDFGIMASSKDWKKKQVSLGVKPDDLYFNSGVLVVDLDAWRANDAGRRIERLAAEHDYQHHDQDALNEFFYRNWTPLPLRWNVIPPVWYLFLKVLVRARFRRPAIEARQNIAILHYAGGYKPWEYDRYPAFNPDYYDCLQDTAFRDVLMPQPNPKRKGRSIKRQLRRLKVAAFWQKLFS